MKNTTQLKFYFTAFCLLFGSTLLQLKAQTSAPPPPPLPQTIIITKKKTPTQKIIVVIDSNNITVNGKPATDFESDDIDIMAPGMADDYSNMMVQAPRFKIKSDMLRDQMMQNMQSNKAFLGVMTEKNEKGAIITEVTDKSAAEKAGLKEGDIITKIDTSKITGPDDLYKVVGRNKPDAKISITYLRGNTSKTTTATLDKNDNFHVYSWNSPGGTSYGPGDNFNIAPFVGHDFGFNFNMKPRLGLQVQDTEDGNGVKVTDTDDEGAAAKAGVKENDIITTVNGKNIKSVDDLHTFIKDIKPGDTVKLNVLHDGQSKNIDVKFPKDLKTMDL